MRLRTGHLLAVEIALAGLLFGAAAGSAWVAPVVAAAAALLVLTIVRVRGRFLHGWLALGIGYLARNRSTVLPGPDALTPVESEDGPVGVLRDGDGLVAVLAVGEPGAPLSDVVPALPSPADLLGADADPGGAGPAVAVQLLLSSRPAPAPSAGNGLPASSYRQLAAGAVPAALRVLVAVRVSATPGSVGTELSPALLGALRRTGRRLQRDGVAAYPLSPAALSAALAEATGPRPTPGRGIREGWSALIAGGQAQAVYRPRRAPASLAALLPHLLALPAAEVTVSLTAHAVPAGSPELTIRLAAPDAGALGFAERELVRLLAGGGAGAVRLDGEHLPGFAATLPLARLRRRPGTGVPDARPADAPDAAAARQPEGRLALPAAGLMVGRNRHGEPVTVRLLRPEPTRAVLVGGGRAAATLVVRALALGTHVVVQTGRPEAWDHLLRGIAGPADAVALSPPGATLALPPASATVPQLVVLDVGPVAADPVPAGPWRTTLLVRDDVSTVDVEALSRADVVFLQPLSPGEAELVGGVLGLGEGHAWLTRIRQDMIGLVSRRSVRWAQLCATPIEQQVIGAVVRVLAG